MEDTNIDLKKLKSFEKSLIPGLRSRKEQIKGIIYFLENNPTTEDIIEKFSTSVKGKDSIFNN